MLHEGACSNTMEHDGRYMMANNYRYTLDVLNCCEAQNIPLSYASSAAVYGAKTGFIERSDAEGPLNVYGYSKLLFDQVMRRRFESLRIPVAGFRYFNVYGPRESHKRGAGASVAFNNFEEFRARGRVSLFGGHAGYDAGTQRRDFVYIDDVVKAKLWFLDQAKTGIFNLGTGQAQTFNELALAMLNALGAAKGHAPQTLAQAVASHSIEYLDFPRQAEGSLPELHRSQPDGAACGRLRCAICRRGRGRQALCALAAGKRNRIACRDRPSRVKGSSDLIFW